MSERFEYHEGSRRLQDHFDCRRIADRLKQVTLATGLGAEHRDFIEQASMFFLATADAEGRVNGAGAAMSELGGGLPRGGMSLQGPGAGK